MPFLVRLSPGAVASDPRGSRSRPIMLLRSESLRHKGGIEHLIVKQYHASVLLSMRTPNCELKAFLRLDWLLIRLERLSD